MTLTETLTRRRPDGDSRRATGGIGHTPGQRVLAGLTGLAFVILLIAAVTTDGFLSLANARAILASMAIIGIVAVGMSCITLSGNLISTTLGTTVVVSTMVFLGTLRLGLVPALVLTLLFAMVVTGAQGWLVGALDANPIMVTIAFGTLQLGVTQQITGSSTVYPPADVSYTFLAATVLGLPVALFALFALVAVVEWLLRRTQLGQEFYLVGENRQAARAAGLRVTTVAVVAFAAAGFCAGLAGIFLGAAQRSATLLTSETYTWDAIGAVLVGGMAITGGRGAVYRTVLGALFIATVGDLLLLRGYSTGVQVLVRGLVILLVVIGMHRWRRDNR